jgi:HD-GYP domain-containing protein (c-di-GMP phosphodiesterase class II)
LQGALVLAFLLLALAQISMVLGAAWTLAWWEYHVLMYAAVLLALGALLLEYSQGRPLRQIVEGTLALGAEVGRDLGPLDTIAALATATELKDPYAREHTVRVAELAVAIGRDMGAPTETLGVLARAGLLHDLGNLAIPDAILLKPGPLSAAEWSTMQRHPEVGLEVLARIGDLRREAETLQAHHERLDGSGYPHGRVGADVPLEARILAVAEMYDALISDRPYRRGLPREEALELLEREAGERLYAPAVEGLRRVLDRGGPLAWADGGRRHGERT